MKRTNKILGAVIGIFSIAAVTNAALLDATVADANSIDRIWSRTAPVSPQVEDNEVEGGLSVIRSQNWDLEMLGLTTPSGGNNAKLVLIGGYDFNATGGQVPGGSVTADYKPGDLFLKINGGFPTSQPWTEPGADVPNSAYGWDYAIRLSQGFSVGSGNVVQVWDLNNNTLLDTVRLDVLRSNPFKADNGNSVAGGTLDSTFNTTVDYVEGQSKAQIQATYGYTLLGDSDNFGSPARDTGSLAGSASDLHNVVTIDLGWLASLVGPLDQVYAKYTMSCGNDMIRGSFTGDFRVPDGGSALLLLGLAVGALGFVGRNRKA